MELYNFLQHEYFYEINELKGVTKMWTPLKGQCCHSNMIDDIATVYTQDY